MLVSIGRRTQPERLVDLLSECHARIRRFLQLSLDIARSPDSPPAEVIDSCQRAERYFVEALPQHVADEEQSLVPRLLGKRADLDEMLSTMRAQHREHDHDVTALVDALRAVAAEPNDLHRRETLGQLAAAAQRGFEDHLALEERVLFPALDLLLPDEQDRIVRELRARRQSP